MSQLVKFLFIIFTFSALGKAPDFSLPVYKSDKTYQLEKSLKSGKTVVLNFWATWCTACIEELPLLRDLQKKYMDKNVEFIAINAGERKKLIKKFLKRYDFPYKIVLDQGRKIAKKFKVENLPQTFVISKEGKILFHGNRPPKTIK
jgi:thiol-disulfide isomerase/thioredoxin